MAVEAKSGAEDADPDVHVEKRVISEADIGKMLELDLKPGKNRLIVQIRPRPYLFSA